MSDADSELRALAEKMQARIREGRWHDVSGFEACADVAIDHFADRLARAEAIEQAARALIKAQDGYMAMQKLGFRRDPGPTIDRLTKARARWAALAEVQGETTA